MRRNPFTALAVALIVSCGMLGDQVNAMTPASPPMLGAQSQSLALLQQAAVICGNNGCAPVQTKRVEHPKKLQSIR